MLPPPRSGLRPRWPPTTSLTLTTLGAPTSNGAPRTLGLTIPTPLRPVDTGAGATGAAGPGDDDAFGRALRDQDRRRPKASARVESGTRKGLIGGLITARNGVASRWRRLAACTMAADGNGSRGTRARMRAGA